MRVARIFVLHRMQRGFRLVLGQVDLHVLQQRHVGVGQANLQLLRVVDVEVSRVARMVPDVVALEVDAPALHHRVPGAADAEVHFGGVVAKRRRLLAGLEHRELDLDSRRHAEGSRLGVHPEHGLPGAGWLRRQEYRRRRSFCWADPLVAAWRSTWQLKTEHGV